MIQTGQRGHDQLAFYNLLPQPRARPATFGSRNRVGWRMYNQKQVAAFGLHADNAAEMKERHFDTLGSLYKFVDFRVWVCGDERECADACVVRKDCRPPF